MSETEVVAYWPRKKMVEMNNRALARMTAVHPELAPDEIRVAIRNYWGLNHRTISPEGASPQFTAINAEAALAEIFTSERLMGDLDKLSPLMIERQHVNLAKRIRQAIARKYGLLLVELDSHCRHKNIVFARHEAMYQIARQTHLSYPRIGRMFGGKDHTTVLHAVQAHADRNGLPRVREGRTAFGFEPLKEPVHSAQ